MGKVNKINQAMNNFIVGKARRKVKPKADQNTDQLTPDQLARIEVYVDAGVSYAEARQLVIDASKSADETTEVKTMNDWIRKAAGK